MAFKILIAGSYVREQLVLSSHFTKGDPEA